MLVGVATGPLKPGSRLAWMIATARGVPLETDILKIESLRKAFGKLKAVDNVSFLVQRGVVTSPYMVIHAQN